MFRSFGNANERFIKIRRMKSENRKKNSRSQGLSDIYIYIFFFFCSFFLFSLFFNSQRWERVGRKRGRTEEGNTSYYATLGSDPFEIPEAIKIEMGNSALPISA